MFYFMKPGGEAKGETLSFIAAAELPQRDYYKSENPPRKVLQ